MSEEDQILLEVRELMGWTKRYAELWYTLPNSNFGNVSPKQMVDVGRAHKVFQFISAAREENFPPKDSK
jgi:hypothetical protein